MIISTHQLRFADEVADRVVFSQRRFDYRRRTCARGPYQPAASGHGAISQHHGGRQTNRGAA